MPKQSSSFASIVSPDDNEWKEILKNFDLAKNRKNQLRKGVVEIADDINKDIAFERRVSKGRDQKEITKHLRDVSKALQKL